MRTGLRPYITAGIALVGASAVAVTPIAAIPRDVKVPNPDVELSANPFDAYLQAIERAFGNAQRVIGQALADPAVFPLTPEQILNSLFGDPRNNLQILVNDFEELQQFLPTNLPGFANDIADNLRGTINNAVAGDFVAAVNDLIAAYRTARLLEDAALELPLDLLGRDLARETTFAIPGRGQTALVGPVISGLLASAGATQRILNALQQRNPQALANASLVVPRSQMFTSVSTSQDARVVTFDVDSTPNRHVADENPVAKDPDQSTNQDVTADDGATNLSDGDKHAPRLFGRHAADRTRNSAVAGPVGEGIHDGIQGFRDGVRDAVKTLTGHANDNSKSTSGDTGASS
jgi:hypothetical protein